MGGSLSQADLTAAAGVDPWNLLAKLKVGNPAQIDELAAAFYRAGNDAADAKQATATSQRYVRAGYVNNHSAPLDDGAEASRVLDQLHLATATLPQIAKVLTAVGADLAGATRQAEQEITTLQGALNRIDAAYSTAMQGRAHGDTPAEIEATRQGFITQGVAAVRAAGKTINGYISHYEATLAASLRSMADLGYIPPDPVDEGPGDVDVPNAKTAADNTIAATKLGRQSTHYLNVSTQYLDLLTRVANSSGTAIPYAHGAALTPAERTWMNDYYTALTPHLGQLKTWGDQQACVTGNGVPNPALPSTKALAIIGNGLLTLTKEEPYASLPKPIRDILAGNVGTTDRPQGDDGSDPALRRTEEWPLTSDTKGAFDKNLNAFGDFTGFLDHYSSPTTTASTDFDQHLLDSALRWKHQLNVIYANSQARVDAANNYTADAGDHNNLKGMSAAEFAKEFPDFASSDALDIVSRDHPFTNQLLHDDPATRRSIMGLNWGDGTGAAHVITSATVPGQGVSASDAATTALDVVRDSASDYAGLAHMANSQVKTAIAGVGATYIDSFAVKPDQANGHGSVGMITLPGGQQVEGLHLDNPTWANYLKFIAASDPKTYANFQTLADQRGVYYVSQALDHGGPGSDAWRQAVADTSRLSGGLAGAAPAVLNDMAADGAKSAQIKLEHDQLVQADQLHQYETQQRLLGGVKTAIGLTPFSEVLDTADTVAGLTGHGSLDDILAQGAPAGVDLAGYTSSLDQYVQDLAHAGSGQAAALAGANDHLTSTIVSAYQAAHQPLAGVTTVGPDGTIVYPLPDGTGSYDDVVSSHVRDLVGSGDINDMTTDINAVYGQSTATNYAAGHDPNTAWASGSAPKKGSLSDSGGNWDNDDDNYRILYGNETRYTYHGSGWTHGSGYSSDQPGDWSGAHQTPVPTPG